MGTSNCKIWVYKKLFEKESGTLYYPKERMHFLEFTKGVPCRLRNRTNGFSLPRHSTTRPYVRLATLRPLGLTPASAWPRSTLSVMQILRAGMSPGMNLAGNVKKGPQHQAIPLAGGRRFCVHQTTSAQASSSCIPQTQGAWPSIARARTPLSGRCRS